LFFIHQLQFFPEDNSAIAPPDQQKESHNRAWNSSNENNPWKKKEIKNLFRNHKWSLVYVFSDGFLTVNNSLVCKFNNTPLS